MSKARSRAGTGCGIGGPRSHVLPSTSYCVIMWSTQCITAASGEQHHRRMMCGTGEIYGGGQSGKV